MSPLIPLRGFIRDIRYRAYVVNELPKYPLAAFSINSAKPAGLLETPDGTVGYSKWVSPKRTRSYPFERIYRTYNAPKIITVIPIIKDEGRDGDIDKIQASTISWMNLLNIYIVLAYYDSAVVSPRYPNKITRQQLNEAHVQAQIHEILAYKQSALHWNRSLIQDRFQSIFSHALDAYTAIARRTGVALHEHRTLRTYATLLEQNMEQFWTLSAKGSQSAAQRESLTRHALEVLGDGDKGIFELQNYLGGIYHLTADEILLEDGITIIQESKNASRSVMPSLPDIRDGLFKLILYSNLDRLENETQPLQFRSRLKLTGTGIQGTLRIPCTDAEMATFMAANKAVLRAGHLDTLAKLRQEVTYNQRLDVEIRGNG